MASTSKAAQELKRLRERTGLSVRDVAGLLEKSGSSYAYYEDEYKKPFLPIDLVRSLIPIFGTHGIDRAELLRLAGIEDDVEALPKKLPPHNGAAPEPQKPKNGLAHIEELDVTVSAGAGATVHDAPVVRIWSIPPEIASIATDAPLERIKILRVKGDSMAPTYNPVDRVMVDTADTLPSPAGVFVVWDGLGFVIKRIQVVPHSDPIRVKITSDNPKYDPYERVLGEAYIQGRVIGKWLWT